MMGGGGGGGGGGPSRMIDVALAEEEADSRLRETGWEKIFHPQSNRHYFLHRGSAVSQWEHPFLTPTASGGLRVATASSTASSPSSGTGTPRSRGKSLL